MTRAPTGRHRRRSYVPGSVGQESAYLYSPAFLVVLSPLRALPWPVFVGLWTAGLLGVLFWLARPLLFLPLLLLALLKVPGRQHHHPARRRHRARLQPAVGMGLRLLTKVTPGVGVLWFAVRREWLNLGIAVAATVAVIAAVALFTPGLWADWFQLLMCSTGSSTVAGSVPIPLVLRVPFALALIAVAARRDEKWLLPMGVLLLMPVIWWGSLALLTASVALKRDAIEAQLDMLLQLASGRYQRLVAARAATPSN